jgi:hypothetical protein
MSRREGPPQGTADIAEENRGIMEIIPNLVTTLSEPYPRQPSPPKIKEAEAAKLTN